MKSKRRKLARHSAPLANTYKMVSVRHANLDASNVKTIQDIAQSAQTGKRSPNLASRANKIQLQSSARKDTSKMTTISARNAPKIVMPVMIVAVFASIAVLDTNYTNRIAYLIIRIM